MLKKSAGLYVQEKLIAMLVLGVEFTRDNSQRNCPQ